MRAAVLHQNSSRLTIAEIPAPEPGGEQVLIRVQACGVCRTDLHIVDGELPPHRRPLVPGHQVVGTVERCGATVDSLPLGTIVGVPWLGWTCGDCVDCRAGRENLCSTARFTGYDIDGGFAEYCVADARYCFPLPRGFDPVDAAPLLCAGLIGYRALEMAGDAERLGFYGFGAAAHILIQVARHQGRQVFAFTRRGDEAAQQFARQLGAVWAGASDAPPPEPLDAALIFAPVGELVPRALAATRPGGRVICAGIQMSEIPAFPYELLWRERSIRSVANLTRRDGEEFLPLAASIPIRTSVTRFPLERAGEALEQLRHGGYLGAGVVIPALDRSH